MNLYPFRIDIPEEVIFELKQKISSTRWPEKETVDDWSQGVPRVYLAELCSHWTDNYNWYKTQSRLNRINQGLFSFDEIDIHYLEVKSKYDYAKPLLLTHGWPGSFLEFEKVIGPLTDPLEYGLDSTIACHVICPTLPGFGFSGKPGRIGWNVDRIARVWDALMKELGYNTMSRRWVIGERELHSQSPRRTSAPAKVCTSTCPLLGQPKRLMRIQARKIFRP